MSSQKIEETGWYLQYESSIGSSTYTEQVFLGIYNQAENGHAMTIAKEKFKKISTYGAYSVSKPYLVWREKLI